MPVAPGPAQLRRRLLLRGRRVWEGDVGDLLPEGLRVEPSPRRGPVPRAELEHPIRRPHRDDAQDLGKVRLGVEAVKAAGRDEREEVAGGAAVVVAADEKPGLAASGKSPFILPMSHFARGSSTRGTQNLSRNWMFCTGRVAAVRRSSSAGCRTVAGRSSRRGCSTPRPAQGWPLGPHAPASRPSPSCVHS